MISRPLGLEIGGAIGIPLYLSQAVSVTFYIIGFTEAFTAVFPGFDPRVISTFLGLVFGLLAYVGAGFALRIQFVVLVVMATALLSFFAGGWRTWVKPQWFASSTATATFWKVFAVWVKHTQDYLDERGIAAFAECSIASDFYGSVVSIIQAHGIGGLETNIALMGWGKELEVQETQLQLMRRLVALQKSPLFLRYDDNRGFGRKGRIDVWWRGRDRNAELMLLLAHIIRQSRLWEGARIRILRLLKSEEGRSGAANYMIRFLKAVRVEAEPVILVRSSPAEPFKSVLRDASRETDLVFLGLRLPEAEEIEHQAREVDRLLESTVSTVLARCGEVEDVLDTDSTP